MNTRSRAAQVDGTAQSKQWLDAFAHISLSIAIAMGCKNIVMTDEENQAAAYAAVRRLSDVEIDDFALRRPRAVERACLLGYYEAGWAYARGLCALLPPLLQSERLSWIAMEHHLHLADKEAVPWPSRDAEVISRFIDRDIGPVTHSFTDGIITSTYYRGIRLHRPEAQGPAFTAITRTGLIVDEQYWRLGVQHRACGPAAISTDLDDGITTETWMLFGRTTRQGAPARIQRAADGRVLFEMWVKNGLLHREDGPAYIERSRWDNDVYEKRALNGVEGPLHLNGLKVSE